MEEFDLKIKIKAKDEAQAQEVLFFFQALANDLGIEKLLATLNTFKAYQASLTKGVK